MIVLQNFVKEVKKFSRANWWVFIIYIILMGVIFLVQKNELASIAVFFITSLHFVADIFIMMMFSAYSRSANRQGTYYQIMSMLIFMSLKIYTGLSDHQWHYFAADPIYILAALKNYRIDIEKSDLKFVNYKTMSVLSLIIIFGVLVPGNLVGTTSEWVQTTGIFLFAIALSVAGNEQLRSEFAIIALIAMVGGSAWEITNSLFAHKIAGLALSYFLLPLTVLVFYVKHWPPKKNFKKSVVISQQAAKA